MCVSLLEKIKGLVQPVSVLFKTNSTMKLVRTFLMLILASFMSQSLTDKIFYWFLQPGNSSKWSRQSKISLFPLANERARCDMWSGAGLDCSPAARSHQVKSILDVRARSSVFSLGILMTPGSQVCSDYHGGSLIMMTEAEYIVYRQTITTIQSHTTCERVNPE